MELAKVNTICMTNSPFDALETPKWDAGFDRDERFTSALRIDPLLLEWDSVAPQLAAAGYEVQADFPARRWWRCNGSCGTGPSAWTRFT